MIGNSLRELNLEDVEPAAASPPAKPTVVEFRTFDGLVVRAEGEKRGDASWVGFTASVDTAQAAPPAGAPDAAAEAARINAKVGPWRYKIATFQYDQMTRQLSDLLKPPAAPTAERDKRQTR